MEQNLIKSEIESRIFTIRGMQVMLDSDLAKMYSVETKKNLIKPLNVTQNDSHCRFDSNYLKMKWKT
jgi:hypothetical protein